MDPVINPAAERQIPIARPHLTNAEADAVAQCIKDTWISQGPRVREFERKFVKYSDTAFGSACNSGTTALQLALRVAELSSNGEVIIPNGTMIAVPNSVLSENLVPVFADADAFSQVGNVSLETIERCVTAKTTAVIVVHTYGEPVQDIKEIIEFCHDRNIIVIEDCAEAHFAKIHGRYVGGFGDYATYSFYSNKNITTGEGGMVCTSYTNEKRTLDRLRMHCFDPEEHFKHDQHAFGFRMTDMQAAVGLEQLKRHQQFMNRRRELYQRYIDNCNYIVLPTVPIDDHGAWVCPILCNDSRHKGALRAHLAYHGIETRSYFRPCSMQPFLREYSRTEYPISADLFSRGFYLPIYPDLSDNEVEYVLDKINSFRP